MSARDGTRSEGTSPSGRRRPLRSAAAAGLRAETRTGHGTPFRRNPRSGADAHAHADAASGRPGTRLPRGPRAATRRRRRDGPPGVRAARGRLARSFGRRSRTPPRLARDPARGAAGPAAAPAFQIQAGSFARRDLAEAEAARLGALLALPASVADAGGRWGVRLGEPGGRAALQPLLSRVRRDAVPDAFLVGLAAAGAPVRTLLVEGPDGVREVPSPLELQAADGSLLPVNDSRYRGNVLLVATPRGNASRRQPGRPRGVPPRRRPARDGAARLRRARGAEGAGRRGADLRRQAARRLLGRGLRPLRDGPLPGLRRCHRRAAALEPGREGHRRSGPPLRRSPRRHPLHVHLRGTDGGRLHRLPLLLAGRVPLPPVGVLQRRGEASRSRRRPTRRPIPTPSGRSPSGAGRCSTRRDAAARRGPT